jgi:hypothetical protein
MNAARLCSSLNRSGLGPEGGRLILRAFVSVKGMPAMTRAGPCHFTLRYSHKLLRERENNLEFRERWHSRRKEEFLRQLRFFALY